jgi:DnaJ-domain-containing protein 1
VSGANGGTIKIWHQSCETNKSQSNFVLSGEWWEVLGVEKGAYPKDVKRAYIRLGRQYHPDINPLLVLKLQCRQLIRLMTSTGKK